MYGHGLAKDMEQWHAQHNGRHDDPEWLDYLKDFEGLVLSKTDELRAEHTNAGKFGMSKAGGCTRASALKRLGHEGTPFSGSSRVTFFIGHLVECLGIATLNALGHKVEGSQLTLTNDLFYSATDGVMPSFEGQRTLLSVKSAGYKKSGRERRGNDWKWVRRGFPELPFTGVLKAQPGHYAQMQAEMYVDGAQQSLYLVVAKDIVKNMEDDPYLGAEGNGSLTFYTELVPYNADFVHNQLLPVWTEQEKAVQAGRPGPARYLNTGGIYGELKPASTGREPNAAITGTFNPCDYCDLVAACKTELLANFRRR